MINFFSNYTRNIATFLIFMSLIGIILPSNKYKKYVSLILGFVLVFIVIEPIFSLAGKNPKSIENMLLKMTYELEHYSNFKNETLLKENDLILDEYSNDLNSQLKIIVENLNQFEVIKTDFLIDDSEENFGEIKSIFLTVKEGIPKKNKKKIIKIEPIKSTKTSTLKEDDENENIKNLKKLISDFYNLSLQNINITVQKS